MKSDWKNVSLGEVARVFNGKTPSKAEQRSEGHPVLKIRDVSELGEYRGKFESFVDVELAAKFPEKRVRDGDTLILNAAHNADYVASKTYHAQPSTFGALATGEWLIVRPGEKSLDGGFVHHWVTSTHTRRELRELVNGIHLYPKDVARLKIPLPPLAEQRRIAEVLDRAEALRAKRRAALAQLDALTQSLFLDLFGDPVANERKWPVQAVNGFVAGFESGKSIVADDEADTTSPYRVLKVSAVTSLEFRPEQSKPMPPGYEPPQSHIVRPGDLLFSRANTSELIGATAYVEATPPNLLLPDKLWRFVWHKAAKADPHFVRFLFQQPKFRQEISQRASGTSGSMKNISQDKVLTIRTGLPPLPLQREFARRVTAVESLKTAQRASLAELDALFATLQHRAFRGEL